MASRHGLVECRSWVVGARLSVTGEHSIHGQIPEFGRWRETPEGHDLAPANLHRELGGHELVGKNQCPPVGM